MPVEQRTDGPQVLAAGLAPGQILVLQHRHREQPGAGHSTGLRDRLQPGLALGPGPELGQHEAGQPVRGVTGLPGDLDDLLRAADADEEHRQPIPVGECAQ